MLSNQEIAALIEGGYEIRSVEFKGPGSINDPEFVAKIARAALALANQRDGGSIIIGVDEVDEARSGLTAEQLIEWLDYDNVSDKLNKFADPPLRLDRAGRQLSNGKDVVVLLVAEFDDIPVLAARDFPRHIQRGQLYTRSFRKPESSASHTQNELRAVLELATQKQVTKFMSLAAAANLTTGGVPTAQSRYEDESADYLADADISDITTAAHFKFTIRPQEFRAERVDYNAIASLIRRAALHLRGWPYPFVSRPAQGASWVTEQETVMHREAWVAFESGQFQSWHALPLDGRHVYDGGADAKPGHGYFPLWQPVTDFTEVLMFAQRLQGAVAPAEPYQVTFELIGAKGWELVPGDRRWQPFYDEHRLQTSAWERTVQLPAGGGPRSGRELALTPSLHLLRRFGWAGASEEVVKAVQESVFGPA
ncbi:AlbA family DNA-binding domain-containing protein [Microbacterium terricola]|uniref:Schlafen AlbA-2 domain-containing protein n=1 Tax=Microbacterium terricola TaxID=344163 RepID=A0ABM8E0G8_9MICO|nr:ATP-binding protein [Microbacterium terricola]UYK40992.1 ATP-binding protein [Microbacterium terricola]BDV31251.1 hypothetical protein Microterr_19110 [Microbacterium terricola]